MCQYPYEDIFPLDQEFPVIIQPDLHAGERAPHGADAVIGQVAHGGRGAQHSVMPYPSMTMMPAALYIAARFVKTWLMVLFITHPPSG